jgi:hypothetical protein
MPLNADPYADRVSIANRGCSLFVIPPFYLILKCFLIVPESAPKDTIEKFMIIHYVVPATSTEVAGFMQALDSAEPAGCHESPVAQQRRESQLLLGPPSHSKLRMSLLNAEIAGDGFDGEPRYLVSVPPPPIPTANEGNSNGETPPKWVSFLFRSADPVGGNTPQGLYPPFPVRTADSQGHLVLMGSSGAPLRGNEEKSLAEESLSNSLSLASSFWLVTVPEIAVNLDSDPRLRTQYLGKQSRRALRAQLAQRSGLFGQDRIRFEAMCVDMSDGVLEKALVNTTLLVHLCRKINPHHTANSFRPDE